QCGFKLYPKAVGKWLFSVMRTKGWAHDVELLHRAKLYRIEFVEMPVNWKEVSDSKISVWYDGLKMGLTSFVIVFQNLFKFFLFDPFLELKKKEFHKITGESPFYRFLFAIFSLFLLFFMPFISFDYGITADEEVQYTYGKHILSYFESNGVDDKALNFKNLYLYGGIFDYSMAWMHKYIFSSWDVFEMRHMFNAFVGAVLMIFTGLLTHRVSQKWQAGFWALVFVFLSPRIFGHCMNNPKDIPFAAGYIISIFFMIGFIRSLPKISISSVTGFIIGLAITINIRVGGILLIPYLFLFTGGAFILQKNLRVHLKKFGYLIKLSLLLLIIVFLGYVGGTLYWPFAKEDWINGPILALAEMSNFATGIRMVWEGQHYWSDFLPWYYILKWLCISTPVIILLGLPFAIYPIIKDQKNRLIFLMVIFAGLFPICYSIYKQSALYDGMRHFLFIYPLLILVSAYSWTFLISKFNNKLLRIGVSLSLLFMLYSPIRWMLVSHPNQYFYFNEILGGVENAYNQYETDYWMNSTKEACLWAIDNIPEIKAGEKVSIGTQAYWSVFFYFQKYSNVSVVYTRYHERVKKKWDYGIYVSRFVNHGIIQSGNWPPGQEILFTRQIDNVPICSVIKRSEINKKGPKAIAAFKAKDNIKALSLLDEIIKDDPKDESALLMMVQYSLQARQLPKAKATLDTLMSFSDTYSNTLGMQAIYYLNKNDMLGAKKYFKLAIEANIKYVFGHFHLARIYTSEKDLAKAIEHLELFDQYGGKPTQGYDLAIQVATSMNNDAIKNYFLAKKYSINGNWKDAIIYLNNCLSIIPDYGPAVKMKRIYDNAVDRNNKAAKRKRLLKQKGLIK
ncbi:tetratricopeptide repeat protein, partial [Aureispira]|nr:tetratricopeptide repeat protein [Aureispira sp.]